MQRRDRVVGDERPKNQEVGVGWVVLGAPKVKAGFGWEV